MLAHELRNPLAPIRTAAELLPRLIEKGDPRAGAMSEVVERQALHLTRLVDDLLDVSRITQGRIEMQRKPVELSAVARQALESVEPQIPSATRCMLQLRATSMWRGTTRGWCNACRAS